MSDNFTSLYCKEIYPILKKFEQDRKEKLKKIYIYFLLGIICFAIPFIYSFICNCINPDLGNWMTKQLSDENARLWWMIGFVSIFAIGVIALTECGKIEENFTRNLKKSAFPLIFKIFGGMQWSNARGYSSQNFPDYLLKNCGLFGEFNRVSADDEFTGIYNGVEYKVSELKLLKKYETTKRRREITLPHFQGVVLLFQSPKNVKSKTIVSTKGDLIGRNSWRLGIVQFFIFFPVLFTIIGIFSLFGYFFLHPEYTVLWMILVSVIVIAIFVIWQYGILSNEEFINMSPIKLEDPKLAKKFNVYSSDEVEARYFLTPSFIERFQNLKTAFGTEKIKCMQLGNDIIFAISTRKNLFELGSVYKSLEGANSFGDMYFQLKSIYKMIEYFKFDEKTGL